MILSNIQFELLYFCTFHFQYDFIQYTIWTIIKDIK